MRPHPAAPAPPAVDVGALLARARNLNPGAWAVERERPLATLLGSCVAVCLHDPRRRLAGMNHFLLPSRHGTRHDQTDIVLAGDAAMEVLANAMFARGAVKADLVAKVFGGGTITSTIDLAIGERNARFALEWLAREGIRTVAQDVMGRFSRRLVFDPASGDAWCRRQAVDGSAVRRLAQAEAALAQRLSAAPGGGIELFG
ncbi:chemotaxis protein CheD [Nitrogeniibacter mangrovi]|uniref:Probable chemoreceptor glutamine deamidase CheD n=1 Tax=Nitrogeniibacter mangrovi TaxID=2016596 RepID=A0A6C1B1E4_9RHOO|nr:chemotaxis protein CheD [Nitrogeniibacter mangrovi]QID16809.1 chemotaxis protein CheD [Nitrogeniibacter mangrovi]